MKIKRFLEKDSRSAMARVRMELGPDAVILSNKRIGNQVELVAAIDLDETALDETALEETALEEAVLQETALKEGRALEPEVVAQAQIVPEVGGATLTALQKELGHLRSMLEGKLSQLSWQDMARRPSAKAALQARLAKLGLSRELCGLLADVLPVEEDLDEYWNKALQLLSSRVSEMREDSLIDEGGVVALMGSTGVGKTTTIAKLAARCVQRHGRNQVALVTTDCYRIGGQEQLQSFADYLQIPMAVATDGTELRSALKKLSSRKLILIDTAGMSQRDIRLYEQFSMLKSVDQDIDIYVILPATAQLRALCDVVNVFGETALAGAIVTKVDESVALGGVLDVLLSSRLKLAYVTDGQKVPEDIVPARARALVAKAAELTDQEAATSFGGTRRKRSANSTMVQN
ncbi:MAG: flagellar biosynthesis protein FlhF [Halioglobus sp.]|jgi:flagellar biosynthesis protein FlhF